jgi:hypothetical protein
MRIIKTIGLTSTLALVVMALGSSSASALAVESCHEPALSCKEASVGTTFTAMSSVIKWTNAFLTNTCESEIEGEITDPLSAGAGDDIDLEITAASFSNCDNYSIDIDESLASPDNVLPWLITTNLSLFNGSQTFLLSGGVALTVLETAVGECLYRETASDMLKFTWANGMPSSNKLEGGLIRNDSSNFLCGLLTLSGGYTITSVSDPGLPGASNLVVL